MVWRVSFRPECAESGEGSHENNRQETRSKRGGLSEGRVALLMRIVNPVC